MELIRPFARLGKNDAPLAGGKGASLGEMTGAGIPVPPGFVVLAGTFEKFLGKTDLNVEIDTILHKVNHQEIHTVEAAAEQIKGLILAAEMPTDIAKEIEREFAVLGAEYVAVRSSATAEDGAEHAWAGQLDSYLNVTKANVLEKVQHCWASLFTPRAIFYRFEKGLHGTKISVAVVVQKMVISEVSGIAFSVHPVTEDYNQLIIEAGFGLGEAIVSGQITPDSYVVEKEPRNILDVNVATQTRGLYKKGGGGNKWLDIPEPKASSQVLTTDQILELSALILKIENHYGFPCDIEWAFAAGPEDNEGKGKFYIVQSRPITTLSDKKPIKQGKQEFEKVFARDFCLAALDIYALSEKRDDKPWLEGPNPHKPYVLMVRTDGTCYIWYNKKGVAWTKDVLALRAKSGISFLREVETNVKKGIEFIKPIYEKQAAVNKKNLLCFIDEFLLAYPWIEAMWWIKSMAEKDVGPGHQNIVRLREETEMLSAATDIVIRKSLEKLYPKLGILSSMIRLEELRGDTIPTTELLQERLNGFVLVDGELILRSLADVAEERSFILDQFIVDSKTTTLRGETAYKGKVRGEVCRVMGHVDFGKIKSGQILISPMTMVDFLPEMKLAVAFVTDEGGITCHAAIVARELKKPCIIGTKIATKVLKDGDMVEVDADNGIVRILKKNSKTVEKQTFIKTGVRDLSLSYVEARYKGIVKLLSWIDIDLDPNQIFYFVVNNDGIITSYLDPNVLGQAIRRLVDKIGDNKDFLKPFYQNFEKFAAHLKTFWAKQYLEPEKELADFLGSFINTMPYISLLILLASIDSFPKEVRNRSLKYRTENDEISDYADQLVRNTIRYWQPKLAGYEKFILLEELQTKSLPSLTELEKRKKGYIYTGKLLTNIDLIDFALQNNINFEKDPATNITALKGEIAYKGKAKGRVRIVLLKEKLDTVKEGDILVSSMTTPLFIPAIKKAAAFITDEGGITCHAAIIAREMKKPCVIATKNATKVLKDGDMVEVDADKGVVRIIK